MSLVNTANHVDRLLYKIAKTNFAAAPFSRLSKKEQSEGSEFNRCPVFCITNIYGLRMNSLRGYN